MSDTKSLFLEMVTPEKVAWSSQAELVVLPAQEGEMGILPNHQPFLVQLKPGEVRVTENGEVRRFAVSGGFAEIKDNKVSLFAETRTSSMTRACSRSDPRRSCTWMRRSWPGHPSWRWRFRTWRPTATAWRPRWRSWRVRRQR